MNHLVVTLQGNGDAQKNQSPLQAGWAHLSQKTQQVYLDNKILAKSGKFEDGTGADNYYLFPLRGYQTGGHLT